MEVHYRTVFKSSIGVFCDLVLYRDPTCVIQDSFSVQRSNRRTILYAGFIPEEKH